MERSTLEALDRDTLIKRAEDAGVARARILTRPELVDELLLRTTAEGGRAADVQRARGFFGRARDLLARIVERGLNLPDAAERIRAASTPPPARTMPPALPTVTLAEMYATQGHTARAVETLNRVLEQEPDHAAARALLNQLQEPSYRSPTAPPLPPEEPAVADAAVADAAVADAAVADAPLSGAPPTSESASVPPQRVAAVGGSSREIHAQTSDVTSAAGVTGTTDAPGTTDAATAKPAVETVLDAPALDELEVAAEPLGMLDDALLPTHYDVDECVALPVDPTTLFVYWEVRERSWEHLQAKRAGGSVVLRVLVIQPAWDGPRTETRDYPVGARAGDWFVRDLPAGCVVRAAIGWKENIAFLPVAHSPALETPPGFPSPVLAESFVRWTPRGSFRVTADDVMGTQVAHAVDAYRHHVADHPGTWEAVAGAAPRGAGGERVGGGPFTGAFGDAAAGGAGAGAGPDGPDGPYRETVEWFPIGASDKLAHRHTTGGPAVAPHAGRATSAAPLGSSERAASPKPNTTAAYS